METLEFIFKICLLGEPNVGKTSIVHRFVQNLFKPDYKATLGVNLFKKDAEIDGKIVSTQIWDLGGQESFKSLRKLYLQGAHGALVIYDTTNRSSFEKLIEWVQSFKGLRGEEPLLLIGNKTDLKDKIKVKEDEGKNLAQIYNMEYLLTSAKTGANIESAFKQLIKKILDKYLPKKK